MTPASVTTEQSQISRSEWVWLAGALLLGTILRLSFPGRMAIEHFDEGVYASNFWFDQEQGGEYPARFLYAPPLLPMVIEWTMIVAPLCGIRPTGFIPMVPCLLAGFATIPSMWWVGRRWFGPTAGIVSAWLVAASDFHSSYSRAALTDVPVCLFILWAVYFIRLAMLNGTRRDILLAGLFTGLAWWTKYNGWLPLAIGLAGEAARQLALPRAERRIATFSTRWLLVAGVSFVIWCPVLIGLQKHGGYTAVAANHRQYVVGLTGWGAAAARQLTHVGLYDNWFGVPYEVLIATVYERNAVAMVGPGGMEKSMFEPAHMLDHPTLSFIVSDAERWGEISKFESAALKNTTLPWTLVLAVPLLLLVISTVGCVCFLRSRDVVLDGRGWFVFAWICGLSVATPFYLPYPRLILPWLIAVWLAVGMSIQMLASSGILFGTSPASGNRKWNVQWPEVVFIGWLIVCTSIRCQIGSAHVWQDRAGLSRSVQSMATLIRDRSDEAIVYVFGEPSVFFALKANGLPLVAPVQSLNFLANPLPRPTFFIRTAHAFRSDGFAAEWREHQDNFEEVNEQGLPESLLVQLDQQLDFAKPQNDESLIVYRVR